MILFQYKQMQIEVKGIKTPWQEIETFAALMLIRDKE